MPRGEVSFLILILTGRCNLKCAYCYNGQPNWNDMSESLLRKSFSFLRLGPARVQLTGGEPTLAPNLIELASELASTRSNLHLSIQTNAVLLDRALVSLFKARRISVGVSLDGAPEVNEISRGGTAEVLKGLKLLEDYKVPFEVTTVVGSFNALRLYETALMLADFSMARGLGLDLLVDKGRRKLAKASKEDLTLGAEKLVKTLSLLNLRRASPIGLRELEMLRESRQGPRGRNFCPACRGASLAILPNGWFYPCGQSAGDEALELKEEGEGNEVFKGLRPEGEHCQGCPLEGRCPGECPSRLWCNRESEPLVCSLYKALAPYT
ncbi:MAG: radical SAM protein [Deltaproteobacteria bacterium]|jgi:uncharacterized protein|nr:radical SAM protein [Deltaproteobacteria bacterium]